MHKIASRIARGAGRMEDLDLLDEVAGKMGMMPGLSICGLPDGATFPIQTLVRKFRREFEEHIRKQEPGRVEAVLEAVN
jgi:NADH-quinone oxidoreductase subunit F